jgi:hypothetical protein
MGDLRQSVDDRLPSTYLSRLGKKCQIPTEPPVSAIARA